jgi:uncharacterized protein (UPF0332 family)
LSRIDLQDVEKIETRVQELREIDSIHVNKKKVAALIGLMVKKSNNNLKFAKVALKISNSPKIKEGLELSEHDSFYDWVIVTAYYAMFHCAHALLATKEIKIGHIRVHEATLYALAKYFMLNKELEDELFLLYEDAGARAEALFNSLSDEKAKRGQFTYERLPKANRLPAEESIQNASQFIRDIETILMRRNYV